MEPLATSSLVHIDDATSVPLRRLGALLRDARGDAGLDDVASRSRGLFDVVDLLEIEAGERILDDRSVETLLGLYGADPGELVASRSRLVIDVEEGTVAAGGWSTSFSPDLDGPDDVLARYLALVYEMRGLPSGTPIPLRTLDVSVLSQALAMSAGDVETRLHVMMEPGNSRVDRARGLLRNRLLLPALGAVVAVTGVGALILTSTADPAPGADLGGAVRAVATATVVAEAPTPDPAPAPVAVEPTPAPEPAPAPAAEPECDIGEGLTIERSEADGQVEPPPAPAPAPEPAPAPAPEPEFGIGEGLTIERSD